jgi:hypothetical protein
MLQRHDCNALLPNPNPKPNPNPNPNSHPHPHHSPLTLITHPRPNPDPHQYPHPSPLTHILSSPSPIYPHPSPFTLTLTPGTHPNPHSHPHQYPHPSPIYYPHLHPYTPTLHPSPSKTLTQRTQISKFSKTVVIFAMTIAKSAKRLVLLLFVSCLFTAFVSGLIYFCEAGSWNAPHQRCPTILFILFCLCMYWLNIAPQK